MAAQAPTMAGLVTAARKLLDQNEMQDWAVVINPRLRACPARTNIISKQIELASWLHEAAYYDNAICHEVAHAMTCDEPEPHGTRWKTVFDNLTAAKGGKL